MTKPAERGLTEIATDAASQEVVSRILEFTGFDVEGGYSVFQAAFA